MINTPDVLEMGVISSKDIGKLNISRKMDMYHITLDPTRDYYHDGKLYRVMTKLGLAKYVIFLDGTIVDLKRLNVHPIIRDSKRRIEDRWTQPFYVQLPDGNWDMFTRKIGYLVGEMFWDLPDDQVKNTPYYEKIKEHREFHMIPLEDRVNCGFIEPNFKNYWITKSGDVWCYTDNILHKIAIDTHDYGYKIVYLAFQKDNNGKKARRRMYRVHRLLAQAFIPIPKRFLDKNLTWDDIEVNHINGIRDDNRLENLEWTDHYENMKHANDVLHSTRNEWINWDQYCHAKQLIRQGGLSDREIGKRVGLSCPTINSLRNNRGTRNQRYYDKWRGKKSA